MLKIILLFIMLSFIGNVNVSAISDIEYQEAFVKLNESYDKFIGSCGNDERLAIIEYANGNLEAMRGGYETVKSLKTINGNVINDFCANYAEDL